MVENALWSRRWLLLSLAVILVWYPALTLALGFWPGDRLDFDQAFNSMAEHLLAGRFDVDPEAIGAEGFESKGRTVAYFGIFCAVLRVPLVLFPRFAHTDITWWSCLAAAMLSALFQARTVLLVWPPPPGQWSRRDWLAGGLLVSMLLAGPHIQFLHPSLFQEPVNWAFAEASAFIYLAVRGLSRGFDGRTFCLMALCAGLALLTRVSFGVGLYAAFGFLLLARGRVFSWLAPCAVLTVFLVVTGIVNQNRWGNPLVFANYNLYGLSQDVTPDRLGRMAAYGAFNPARLWLTLVYYFVPIWIWVRTDGHVLFAEAQATLMDAMELPAGSFLLTDSLILGLATAGAAAVRDRIRAALLLGSAVQPLLILFAISTAHRYRIEFYPTLFLAAMFGLSLPAWRVEASPRFRRGVIAIVLFGIVMSHAMAVIAARTPLGPGEFYLERYGPVGMYLHDGHF